jgi:hypothetical protein
MDCKIGVRTYLEEELDRSERDPKPRAVWKFMFDFNKYNIFLLGFI